MSEDWLEETYNRSPDKCAEVSFEDLFELAELTVLMNQGFDLDEDDPLLDVVGDIHSIDGVMNMLTDPFLSNVKESRKNIYLQAAKMSGIKIEFGPAKCGGEERGYVGLYSPHKGRYDLGNFWDRVREIDGLPPFKFPS